ncbi:MAG: hypothetical protein WCE21_00305 [Candidatus Babeliales bacterium]
MKPFNNDNHHDPFSNEEKEKNQRFLSKLKNRLNHLRHKVSRGAANMYRAMKSRGKWGNKQIWPGDKNNNHHNHKK